MLTRLHRSRERNRKAVEQKKRMVIEAMGKLACEACGFDFQAAYGDLGKGFAECHHILPLADLPKRRSVRLSDLAIRCANCHRMIHRTRPVMGISEFRHDVLGGREPAR